MTEFRRFTAKAANDDAMEEFGPPVSKLPLEDKARKMLPIFTFLTEYFPDVIVELTELCVQGNIQHNPELAPADIKWAREKSADQLNTAFRHMFDRGTGTHRDGDNQPHLIKAIWRLCAQRQLDKEAERAAARMQPGSDVTIAAVHKSWHSAEKSYETGKIILAHHNCNDCLKLLGRTSTSVCSDCGVDMEEQAHAATCLRFNR